MCSSEPVRPEYRYARPGPGPSRRAPLMMSCTPSRFVSPASAIASPGSRRRAIEAVDQRAGAAREHPRRPPAASTARRRSGRSLRSRSMSSSSRHRPAEIAAGLPVPLVQHAHVLDESVARRSLRAGASSARPSARERHRRHNIAVLLVDRAGSKRRRAGRFHDRAQLRAAQRRRRAAEHGPEAIAEVAGRAVAELDGEPGEVACRARRRAGRRRARRRRPCT